MILKMLAPNRCIAVYMDSVTRKDVIMEVFAPKDGGYVRLEAEGYPQVCKLLALTGEALCWDPECGTLSELIGHEYRALQRSLTKTHSR